MLKKLAIFVLAIFCIIVELTVNTKCLSLSKRAKTVLYPKSEKIEVSIIESKKLALMQGPRKLETTEIFYEENQNENIYGIETVEEKEQRDIYEEEEYEHIEENIAESYESNVENSNEEKKENPKNSLIIGNNVIKIKIAPGTQANINSNDVVQDNEYFSDEDNIVIFGHNLKLITCDEKQRWVISAYKIV